jgi:tetrapyrrole methylase family protein/MazG family protein
MSGPLIAVVGLGPAGPEHLTRRAAELIDSAGVVVLRTARHPAAAAVLERRPDATTFDGEYDKGESFEQVYEAIVAALLSAALGTPFPPAAATVCYAVPGSPSVAERTVELLRERAPAAGVDLAVVPAVSYLDLAFDRLGIDPVASGVRILDAGGFAEAVGTPAGPLLLAQTWSRQVLSEVKLAIEEPPASQRAVLLHHLGLPDEEVAEVAWSELDRTIEPDHLTSVFVPGLPPAPASAVAALAGTVATLRQRCPWDRAQTHRSLLRHLLEECYEAIEAIEALGDDPSRAPAGVVAHAEEELGDLLCQVIFHATLGAEEGLFSLAGIARRLEDKLVARHPHVFGSVHADTADDVVRNWERAKDEEKRRSHLLDGIPATMPALAMAEKIERKLRSVGLGWEESGSGSRELAALVTSHLEQGSLDKGGPGAEEAAGDLLAALARHLADRRLDPEAALRRALGRLGERLRLIEASAAEEGISLHEWVSRQPEPPPLHELRPPLC